MLKLVFDHERMRMKEQDNEQFLSGQPELAPAQGLITKKFMSGPRKHYGIDIGGKIGDPVLASAAGMVVFAGWTPELGNMVVISHADGYISVYGHNDRLNVQERQRVFYFAFYQFLRLLESLRPRHSRPLWAQ